MYTGWIIKHSHPIFLFDDEFQKCHQWVVFSFKLFMFSFYIDHTVIVPASTDCV